MNIRLATENDLYSIFELERRLFDEGDAISKRSFKHFIQQKTVFCSLNDQEQITGVMVLLKRINSPFLRIYSIGIHPDHQGLGYAKALLSFAKQQVQNSLKSDQVTLKGIRLEVSERNESAIALYEKHGFIKYDTKPCYYADGSGAIKMLWKVE